MNKPDLDDPCDCLGWFLFLHDHRMHHQPDTFMDRVQYFLSRMVVNADQEARRQTWRQRMDRSFN